MSRNDRYPCDEVRPLRFVFFGHSIVSDWDNPIATISRSLLRELNKLGHETRFLEERGNRATVGLLHARGSAPLREFTRDFSDIVYRTYELPKGLERTIWLARELGDVDAAVALDDAPQELLDELAHVTLPRLVRVVLTTGEDSPPFAPDITLSLPPPNSSTDVDVASVARSLTESVNMELSKRRSLSPAGGKTR